MANSRRALARLAKQNRVSRKDISTFLSERDAYAGRISEHPTLVDVRERQDGHADAAFLEAWLNGVITDEQIEDYMRPHKSCGACAKAYATYARIKHAQSIGDK